MSFRKLHATQIFDGYQLRTGQVLILQESGVIEGIVPISEAGAGIENHDGILSPGFINCHCHLELSHMRSVIPEKTGLVDFVRAIVNERHFPDKEILEAMLRADSEMYANGIQAVGDICNHEASIPVKKGSRLHYYNFIEASGWHPSIAAKRFSKILEVYHLFEKELPHFTSAIVPHAPYSVSGDLWKAIQPYFTNKTVSIHNQETKDENDFFQHGSGELNRLFEMMRIDNSHHRATGFTSIRSYFKHLEAAKKILLVHNSFTSAEDLDFVFSNKNEQDVFFCVCINANQYIERQVPPVDLFVNKNCNVVIGTDSLASNHRLSIAEEIKTIQKFFPSIPLPSILSWATINGAKALEAGDKLGSFEKGKIPGVILIQADLSVNRVL